MYLAGGTRLTASLVQQPAAAGGVRLVGRARARLDEVVSVELVVLHSVGPVRVAVVTVRLREQVTWVAYDSRENGVFQRHAQLGDITRPRPVAAQLLYARCRSSATAEQALSPHRRGQVQDAPKCARVRVIVVAAAAGAVLLRPVPWSDAALRQP